MKPLAPTQSRQYRAPTADRVRGRLATPPELVLLERLRSERRQIAQINLDGQHPCSGVPLLSMYGPPPVRPSRRPKPRIGPGFSPLLCSGTRDTPLSPQARWPALSFLVFWPLLSFDAPDVVGMDFTDPCYWSTGQIASGGDDASNRSGSPEDDFPGSVLCVSLFAYLFCLGCEEFVRLPKRR
jgi:hypothetical protein